MQDYRRVKLNFEFIRNVLVYGHNVAYIFSSTSIQLEEKKK